MSKKKKAVRPITGSQTSHAPAKAAELAAPEMATGYLPTAQPPAKNLALLVVSVALLAGWLMFLGFVALSSQK